MSFPKKKSYPRFLIRHFFVWTFALSFWTIMRELGQDVIRDYPTLSFWGQVNLHCLLGAVGGVTFGSLDYFLQHKILKKAPLGQAILIGSIGYLLSIIILITSGMTLFTNILDVELNWEVFHTNIFTSEVALLIVYCFLVALAINFVREVDKKFGPGNLWKMIKGEFYTPKEDERIIMFLDLKASTTIAEQLGHIRYSQFIQDCFKDLDIIQQHQAEIYQYVGDEVVLTWPKEIGLTDANCIRTFFSFKENLNARAHYYLKRYGILPEFKAGLNVGKIVVAEVGDIKTEIAFHGDTINTAARIQGECNRLQSELLISENLKLLLNPTSEFEFKLMDQIQLRGKQSAINLFSAGH